MACACYDQIMRNPLLAATLIGLTLVSASLAQPAPSEHPLKSDPAWHDGKAEIATYDLTYPRYGELRKGTAVAIFVTEPISRATRVKIERPGHDPADVLQVVKLNLVKDFQTGVYDYNLMTSVFVSLEPVAPYPAGSVAKVSFSCQEWCGQVFQQALFKPEGVKDEWRSYFEAESDGQQTLANQPLALSEDALLMWARGWAEPMLAAGDSKDVKVLRSLETSRVRHTPVIWMDATLTRDKELAEFKLEGQTIPARKLTVKMTGELSTTWTIVVEDAAPNRVLSWSTTDGQSATLIKSARMPYWQMHSNKDESALKELGLGQPSSR